MTLSFSGDLEERYRAHYLKQNIPYMRMAGIVATIMWVLFGLTDLLWASPETLYRSAIVRYGVVFPVQAVTILASLVPRWYKVVPRLFAASLVAVAVGLIGINASIPMEAAIPIEVGFVLLTVAAYTFFRLPFVYGFTVSMLILLLNLINSLVTGMPIGRVIYDVSLLLVSNVFGGFAGFAMEYYERLDFRHRDRSEREKSLEIEMTNLRTAQQLARAIAHEFNNPLHVIKATYELDIKPLQHGLPSEDRENLERIPQMVERMSRLVANLLDITHLSRRDYVKGVEIIDLHRSSIANPGTDTEALQEETEPDMKDRPAVI